MARRKRYSTEFKQQALKRANEPGVTDEWFVSTTSGDPMRYTDNEKHPDLYRTTRIITSAKVLKRNLDL